MKLFVTGDLQAGRRFRSVWAWMNWTGRGRCGRATRFGFETEILEVRPSRSKPDRGIIRIRNVTTNQNGEVVQTFLASVLVRRRPAA